MTRKLTDEQVERYYEQGYLVLEGALPAAKLAEVIAETERMVSAASQISGTEDPSGALDLDPSHTPETPRVRRIKSQHQHSAFFKTFVADPEMLDLVDRLMPSGIRIHNTKINMKFAGVGESVEWHQDWAFYPHTNDDVLALGIYLDDCTLENGPMMVVPGSHKGPTYDHHTDGYFCGAFDASACPAELEKAVPLTGPAGTVTIHHARLIHGSAYNRSAHPRRFLLHAYAAVDAWPIVDMKGTIEDFDARIVRGVPTVQPRVVPAPIRIPLPLRPEARAGSIYDNQSILKNRYFDDLEAGQPPRVA